MPRAELAVGLLLVAMLASGCERTPPPAESLLLITLDTTRADHLGAWGYAAAQTPNLDRLVAEGLVYERAYSPAPETLPSHATLLTGLYPPSHGVRLNLNFKLPAEAMTLAEIFADQGFDTAAVVSAGVLDHRFGLDQGFTAYHDPPHRARPPELPAEETTRRALEAANGFEGGRYFLWVHYYDPHSPFEPKAPFEAPDGAVAESVELYDLEIAYMDHWVGKLLDGLRERRLLERTAVIVVGDHGESLGEHGETYHTLYIYDATQHVPLIIRAPGLAAGRRVTDPVSTVDVFATALELVGLEVPQEVSSRALPGLDPGGAITSDLRRAVFSESMAPPLRFGWAGLQAVRFDRWLYIRAPREELYDFEADPGQLVNLAQSRESELDRMRHVLARTLEAMPADISAATAGFEPGADELAKLESLGYVAASSQATALDRPLEGEDPKDMVEVAEAYQLARLARRLRRRETAEELLHFVVTADPANNAGWIDYGSILMEQRRFTEALEALGRAVALRRGGRTLVLLASAQRQLGNHEAARRHLDEALEVSQFPGEVWRSIARHRLALEDSPEGAMEAYRKVLEHRPGDERATAALRRLEENGSLDAELDAEQGSYYGENR